MDPITQFTSRTAVLPQTDIDTDQIIPARFLTTTTREGLGKHAFADWKHNRDGTLNKDFALNKPEAAGCQILVAGHNVGCGSSREHAPWALLDAGFRAVISTQIADIFRSNASRNGLIPIIVDEATHAWLVDHPGVEVGVDIVEKTISMPGGRAASFPIDSFARHCLMTGVDEMGYLLQKGTEISQFEEQLA